MLTLRKIAQIIGVDLQNSGTDIDQQVTGFSIDTRTLKPGNVFVALTGETHHGNAFINAAIERGAVAIITDQPYSIDGMPCILLVDDSLAALVKIAEHQRAAYKGKVVGVTGTVGKTSVKEALSFLLRNAGLRVHASEKSYNNHIGVPLTLANLNLDADIGVFEIGMNHPGEIIALSRLVRPNVAIVTAVGPGHIEFFPSVEDIAKEKVSIAASLTEGGVAILPADSEFFSLMNDTVIHSYKRSCLSFGATETADIHTVSAERVGLDKQNIIVRAKNTIVTCDIPSVNAAWINNSLAIVAIVHALGLDTQTISKGFSALPMTGGRGRICSATVNGKHITLIDDAYNANPLSMTAALETLAKYPGRKIAVLGDMRELGRFSEHYHVEIGKLCNALGIDKVLTCGTWMEHAFNQLTQAQKLAHVSSYTQIESALFGSINAGDMVLFKASNGVKLHTLVAQILGK